MTRRSGVRQRVTVCTHTGPDGSCPNLVTPDEPCPDHGRPKNASWSPDRDRASLFRLRYAVIKARGARCERCGWASPTPQGKGLFLHHIRPEDEPDAVQLLCGDLGNNCHGAIDTKARG